MGTKSRNAPPALLVLINQREWMLSEIFPALLEHFDQMAASPKHPPLLYDNYSLHITFEAVMLA